MSIPKEPRQQMINIMYLVLIALLALSVSAEILNAFKVVNRGITNSNNAITEQIEATLRGFEEKLEKDRNGEKYYKAAKQAGDVTREFITYLDEIEVSLQEESGYDKLNDRYTSPQDQETPSRVLIGNDKDGKAYELQRKIDEIREKYIELFKPFARGDKRIKADMEYLSNAMPLNAPPPPDDSDKDDWALYNFYQIPVIGASTLLNQIRNDAIATEAMVVQRFSEKVGGITKKIDFNNMRAIVMPNAESVMEGDPYNVQIFLASTANKERPAIMANGQSLSLKNDGSAEYKVIANGVGRKTLRGSIAVKDANGEIKNIPFNTEYEVTPRIKDQKDKDKVIDELRKQLEELKRKLQNTPDPRDKDKIIDDLKRKLQEIERINQAANPKEKDKIISELRKQTESFKRELDDLKRKQQPKQEPKDNSQAIINDLKQKLQQAEQRIKQMDQAQKATNPKQKDKMIQDLQSQVQKQNQQIKQLEKKALQPIKQKDPNPTGVVSPDKMNVFYIGVDNPISVSVSGASLDAVQARITTGTLTPAGRGKYIARVPPPAGKTTTVSLTARGAKISGNLFRIKRVPDPVPALSGKSGGVMGTGEMKAQRGLMALLKDFDFDAKFEVLGFELTVARRGEDLMIVNNPGARFNDKSKKLLNMAEVGAIYYFDNIRVKGPDGANRKLPSISFKIR